MVPAKRYFLFFGVAAGGCAVDLATKSWVFGWLGMPWLHAEKWIWPHIFSLTTSLNEGALFGLGQGLVFGFAALSIAAAIFIVYWLFIAGAARDAILTFTLGLISAGILGNLYDRLGLPDLRNPESGARIYAVRDWLHFQFHGHHFPIFNIADSMLVCGAALLFWHVWMLQKTAAASPKSADESAPASPAPTSEE